jgi:DNA-binding transcriptional MerR regulator
LPEAVDYIAASQQRGNPHSMTSPSATERAEFTIGELAREFDVTPRTIRFYEDQGLLAPRRDGQRRVYAQRDRTRLKLTLRGKRLGLSLSEIRELIDMYEPGRDDRLQLERFLALLESHRTMLEQQRADLESQLAEIEVFEKRIRKRLAERRPSRKALD